MQINIYAPFLILTCYIQ